MVLAQWVGQSLIGSCAVGACGALELNIERTEYEHPASKQTRQHLLQFALCRSRSKVRLCSLLGARPGSNDSPDLATLACAFITGCFPSASEVYARASTCERKVFSGSGGDDDGGGRFASSLVKNDD